MPAKGARNTKLSQSLEDDASDLGAEDQRLKGLQISSRSAQSPLLKKSSRRLRLCAARCSAPSCWLPCLKPWSMRAEPRSIYRWSPSERRAKPINPPCSASSAKGLRFQFEQTWERLSFQQCSHFARFPRNAVPIFHAVNLSAWSRETCPPTDA
jgi:hypothetical protein